MKSTMFYYSVRSSILLAVFLWLGHAAAASLSSLKTDSISSAEGLAEGTINSIFQDSQGFLWFGTENGLSKYDGYQFTLFTQNPADPTSLGSNRVLKVFEDREGNLWVATDGGGLNLFDRDSSSFIRYQHDPDDSSSISGNRLSSLIQDAQGVLWVGTFSGLNRFDPATGVFESFVHDPANPDSLSSSLILSIYEDSQDTLWIGTYGEGLNEFDRTTGNSRRFTTGRNPLDRDGNAVSDIIESESGDIWIATGHELVLLDRNSASMKRYTVSDTPQLLTPGNIAGSSIYRFHRDHNNRLWVATWGAGMNLYVPDVDGFQSVPFEEEGFRLDVHSVYQDRSNILWIGLRGGGLHAFDFARENYTHYPILELLELEANREVSFQQVNSILGENIQSLIVDDNNQLWIGSWGDSLTRFDIENNEFWANVNWKDTGVSTVILSQMVDSNGIQWIGTSVGIMRYDEAADEFTAFRHDPNNSNSISHNVISSIVEDTNGDLWIGTANGLNRFDPVEQQFTRYYHDSADPNSILSNDVRKLLVDSDGRLWIGTFSSGLSRRDQISSRLEHFYYDASDPYSLSDNRILALYLDTNNVLWVGTGAGGLNHYDPQSGRFDAIGESDGLMSNSVLGLTEDGSGALLIATPRGLSRLDPSTNEVRNFDRSHGLPCDDLSGAMVNVSDDLVFLGTSTCGVLSFDPAILLSNPAPPDVVITDFYLHGESIGRGGHSLLQNAVTETDRIELNFNDNFFAFEFAALSYTSPLKNQYEYRLAGLEDNWQKTTGERRYVNYTDLDPGNYSFQVRAANNYGIWNRDGASLALSINPPWWATTSFRILMALMFIAALYGMFQFRSRVLREHNRELGILVADRTAELESTSIIANSTISNMSQGILMADKNGEILTFNDRLLKTLGIPKKQVDSLLHIDDIREVMRAGKEFDNATIDRATKLSRKGGKAAYDITSSKGKMFDVRQNPISGGGFVRTYTDITERKETEAFLGEVLSNTLDGIVTIDQTGTVNSFNYAAEELFGYTADEVIGKSVNMLMPHHYAKEHDGYMTSYDRTGQGKIIGIGREVEGEHKDGSVFPMDLSISETKIGNNHIFTGIVRDISQRKQAEAVLEEQSGLVKLLQTTASEANSALNFRAAVRACLDSVCSHTGWPIGHAYVLSDEDDSVLVSSGIWHLGDPDLFTSFVEMSEKTTFNVGIGLPGRVLESGEPAWITDVAKDANFPRAKLAENIKVHGAFALPVHAGGRIVGVLEFFDEKPDDLDESLLATVAHIGDQLGRVFERDQAEEILRISAEEAHAATQAKATFLASMSHEIRTPMNGVVGMVDLLNQTELDSEQSLMLRTVRDSGRSLLTIINDILDFSKVEAGKLELEEVESSVIELLEGAAQTMAPNAIKNNVQIVTHINSDVPKYLLADPVRVRQILINLGGNAIKFSSESEVVIKAELVESKKKKVTVRFSIIDQGVGISDEAQKSLFEEFSQADKSTTRKFGGTGLGLAISKRLTEIMDGVIGVSSVLGEGSTFYCDIPFKVSDRVEDDKESADLADLRILIVSNSANYRAVCSTYLTGCDADIETVADISRGLKLVQDYQAKGKAIDIVLIPDPDDHSEVAAACKSFTDAGVNPYPRFVIGEDPRQRSGVLQEIENLTVMDINPLRRVSLMTAVAVAAGRASPEIQLEEKTFEIAGGRAPTPEEALEQGKLILLAEDNLTNQDVIRRQLTRLGYACEIASDGKEAYDMWRRKSYATLLTDCHMPEWDGFELTAAIRKDEESASDRSTIIAITANALQGEAGRCIAAGMDDYMSKPVEMKVLQATLRKWMGDGGISREDLAQDPVIPKASNKPKQSAQAEPNQLAIDERALKDVFGDDEETFKEILNDFMEPCRSTIKEIQAGYEAKSAEEVKSASHKLKSAARSVGATEIGELCAELESAGMSNDWDTINAGVPRLDALMSQVEDYIEKL